RHREARRDPLALRNRPAIRERGGPPDADGKGARSSIRRTRLLTRRQMLGLLASMPMARTAFAQGISTRGVKAQPRGKPSGRPFLARCPDVAAEAGLPHPTVYGGVDAKSYIVEVVGCGLAFLDYDNDGWPHVLGLAAQRPAP